MVESREVEYYGLILKVEATDKKPFYLTGDTSRFKLTIANPRKKKRAGKLSIKWCYGFGWNAPNRFIPLEIALKPKETRVYELPSEWHRYEGAVSCVVEDRGPPEKYANVTIKDFYEKIKSTRSMWHVLSTYKVLDKATYEEQKRRHEELLKEQKAVKEGLKRLKEEIAEVARKEAREEVMDRLALALKMAFTQEKPSEKKSKKRKASFYG